MDQRRTDDITADFVRAASHPALAAVLGDESERMGREVLDTVEADRELLRIIARYRTGHRAEEAPILLAALAPVLVPRLARLRPQGPVFARNDLRQELVLGILTAALTIPLSDDSRFIARRLMRRATWRIARGLRREQRLRRLLRPLPEQDDDDSCFEEA